MRQSWRSVLNLLTSDDTKGLKQLNGPEDQEKLQRTLSWLEEWAEKWGMTFNIPKCKIMHVGPHNPGYIYDIFNVRAAAGGGGGGEGHRGDGPQEPETS